MQVGFGFPEGYGPNKDVTFTVYHYKLDDKNHKAAVCAFGSHAFRHERNFERTKAL